MSASDWKRVVRKMRPKKKVSKPLKTYVHRAISRQIETKVATGYQSSAEITSTANIIQPVDIAQGDDISNRAGDAVTLTGLQWRLVLRPKSAANPQLCRLILVQWKPNYAALAPSTLSQFVQDPSNQPLFSPLKYTAPQFKILADRLVAVPGSSDTYARQKIVRFNIGRKRLNTRMKFNSNSDNEGSNTIILVALSENVSGTSALTLSGYARVAFKDA